MMAAWEAAPYKGLEVDLAPFGFGFAEDYPQCLVYGIAYPTRN